MLSRANLHESVRLDFEHSEQRRLLAELRRVVAGGDIDHDLLKRVTEQSRLHYQLEEMLMEEHGYPELDAHAAEHEGLLAGCNRLRDVQSIDAYLAALGRHISEGDTKILSFIGRTDRRA